ncbi:MAG: AraC family transcriptional regulator [Clostridia bacterium]|nr:AraC family transcriptional regulator [Clostridia bacterium]
MTKISFRSPEYMYSYHLLEPPKLKMHLHQYYEFLYFQRGNATYMVEDNSYEANCGDIFITRPNELHTIIFHTQEPYERQFIQISPFFLSDTGVDLLGFINHRAPGEYNKISADLVQKYHLDKYFDNVRYYIENRLAESDIMVKTYVIQFLVHLNSVFKEFENGVLMQKKNNPKVDAIIEYINKNISRSISLDELADHFFLNKYYMCHMFKANMGLSVKEFINTRKIAMAKTLLKNCDDFTTVCFKCGFNDYSAFYKTFKRFTGVSPRKFLK